MVKGKKFRKLTSLAVTTAMSVMMMTSVVSAETTYTPVNGDNTTCVLAKYLIVDEGDTIPNATFNFTVAAGSAKTYDVDGKKMEVLAGVGSPTIADVTFAPSDTTILAANVASGDVDVQRTLADRGVTSGDGVHLDAGEKYAKKTTVVDFSGVGFTEPGIYRYIVSETANATHAAAGIEHDNDADRVLDVYVTDNGSGELVVSSYVLHKNVSDVAMGDDNGSTPGGTLADKTDGFTNEYNAKDLKFEKAVTGNQASRDKYFKFTVTVTGINENDTYVVSLANDNNDNTPEDGNADAAPTGNDATTYSSMANPTSVSGSELLAGKDFYLQHGQSIVIRGLAPNAEYTVTETPEDYKSAEMTGKTNSGVIGTVAGNEKTAQAGFTNTRDGLIPTGVILSVAGLLVVGIIAVIGFVFFGIRSKKRYDED